jgi:5-methylcytosine-specific restriction endonuclease McrA
MKKKMIELYNNPPEGMRFCNQCEKVKPEEGFHTCGSCEMVNIAHNRSEILSEHSYLRVQVDEIHERMAKMQESLDDAIAYMMNKKKASTRKRSYRLSKTEREEIIAMKGNVCANCGRKYPNSFIHVDHIRALDKGGDNHPDNLQILCKDCNLLKMEHEFKSKS